MTNRYPSTEKPYVRAYHAKNKHIWRRWYWKRMYGITPEDYDALLKAQNGACGICGRKPPFGRIEWLCVDHDHETKAIRGLLCVHCNSFLGRIKDDATKVSNYLDKIKKKEK